MHPLATETQVGPSRNVVYVQYCFLGACSYCSVLQSVFSSHYSRGAAERGPGLLPAGAESHVGTRFSHSSPGGGQGARRKCLTLRPHPLPHTRTPTYIHT